MAKTPNLGLTLTGTSESDSNQTFLNWRTDMSGVGPGSNMQLIDAAYGNLRQAQEDAADDIADLKDAVDELSALSDDVDDISQPYNLVTTHSRATFFVDPNNAYIQVDDSSPGEYNIWVARVEPGKTYAILTDESPISYLLWMVSPIEVLGEDEIGVGNPLMDGATLLTSGSNIITIPNNVNNKFIAFRSSNEFTNGMVAECFAEPGYGTAETKTANDVMARAETKALKQEVAGTKDVVMSAFVANTVSGTAISFDDGADDVPVGSFMIDIEATQSGSGDPSPDNVRTIVGRTSTTVTQHGKNLANVVDNTYTSSGVTFTSANGAVRMSGTSTGTINRTIGTVQLLAGVKYIISGTKSSGIADSDTLRIDLRTSSGSVIASGNSYDGFAYTPNEDIIAQVNIRFVSGQTINATVYPQVEAGETATDFEPYAMISRTIDWSDVAGPIFHGTLDVLTGQLTVDRILFQTTWGAGTIQNTKDDIITKVFSLPMSYSIATGAPASSKCNVCTYKLSMSAYTESAFQFVMQQESGAYRPKCVMGLPSSTSDDQVIQVAYIINTPAVYHLVPVEVRTLLGVNYISAISDNIALEYYASPSSIKTAIDDLIKIQATQPDEYGNKIWFDTDIDNEFIVPEYEEFVELKTAVDALMKVGLDNPTVLQQLCASGKIAKYFDIGDVIYIPWTDNGGSSPVEYEYPFVVVHIGDAYDPDGNKHENALWLMAMYATPRDIIFDAAESTAVNLTEEPNALEGWYYWGVDGSDYTELNLNTGDAIPTTHASVVKCGINNVGALRYGYNRWKDSAYRQWLNSDAAKNEGWWTEQHMGDRPPAAAQLNLPGWLDGFTDEWKAIFKPVKVDTACNTVTDGGVTDTTYDTFFLPSLEQMYGAPQAAGVEGDYWEYWKEETGLDAPTNGSSSNTNDARKIPSIANPTGAAVTCRLRSAYRGYANVVWIVTAAGYLGFSTANNSYRALPACVIY